MARASGTLYAPLLLKRQRATPQQVGLNAEARRKNMRKAFAVSPDAAFQILGKSVLLVDDVRTTGATVTSCVEALKAAGAVRVDVLSFALVNQPFKPHIEM